MKHRTKVALAVALTATVITAANAQMGPAPTETNFQVRTTGDLVRLCEATPNDPTGIAALHFCHGFAVGAYQYHQVVTAAEGKRQLVCAPTPPPSRNDAVSAFVAWAKQNPKLMDTPPVDGLFRFLSQRYPCRA
ncbi:Rap1a/Tai family immunity protein [Azospirillum argentinense]|uniref:Rap1a immunity protein domain-containing protein n=1 Tax=Azospirillum brasilense TaxID=192 RepID=A0A4D8Q614_AZOBR|nr:Rap1a/Tai family immunity protein [Azospirillum argentinense]QCO01632.1 hypothetical protein D3867_06020 [Azospirillum argentinense]